MSPAKRLDFSAFPRVDVARGETLFLEDEDSRDLYVLLAGALGVFREEVQVATIDEPLSIVGEISALTRAPRNATVRALRLSKLVVVSDPDRLFAEHPTFGAKLARLLARRLAEMNGRFIEVKSAFTKLKLEVGEPVGQGEVATLPPGMTREALLAASGAAGPGAAVSVMASSLAAAAARDGGGGHGGRRKTDAPAAAARKAGAERRAAPASSPAAGPARAAARAARPSAAGKRAVSGLANDYAEEVLDALSTILDWEPSADGGL